MTGKIEVRLSEYVADELRWKADLFFQYDTPDDWRTNTEPDMTNDELERYHAILLEMSKVKKGANIFTTELAEHLHEELLHDEDCDWFTSGCLKLRNRLGIALGHLVPFVPHYYTTFGGQYKARPDCVIDNIPYMWNQKQ